MAPTAAASFFCSWSGGKDSCLALYHAIQNGGTPRVLLTMMVEDGGRSRSHGLPASLIQRQAQSLGIPLLLRSSSWDGYEEIFLCTLAQFKRQGIDRGVFGDIDLEAHLEWVERVCSATGISPYEPLWKRPRHELLEEFFSLGFSATIIAVRKDSLDGRFLGRRLDRKLVLQMEKEGIDPSGEKGEYHTVVTAGPLFSFPLRLEPRGQFVRGGYSFLEVAAARTGP